MRVSLKDMRSDSGIYAIVHVPSGRVYVGSAVNFGVRWYKHVWHLDIGRHQNRYLQAAWDKHGAAEFTFMPLEAVSNEKDLLATEQAYLDRIRPFVRGVGFNLSPTAGSQLGFRHSDETREKCRKISTGRVHPPEVRERISAAKKGRCSAKQLEANRRTIACRAKLNDSQAAEILRRRLAGESGLALSREFGVSETVVCQIYKRQAWKHLPLPEMNESRGVCQVQMTLAFAG